jgi:hypothetical protein
MFRALMPDGQLCGKCQPIPASWSAIDVHITLQAVGRGDVGMGRRRAGAGPVEWHSAGRVSAAPDGGAIWVFTLLTVQSNSCMRLRASGKIALGASRHVEQKAALVLSVLVVLTACRARAAVEETTAGLAD